jgi:Mg2+ and Co2+ transporter CorA
VNADSGTTAAPSTCRVVHERGSSEQEFSRENVQKLLAGGFFWLDLDQPDSADFEILTDVFKFHPLAVEDSENFNQRAKFDEYDDFVFIVVYGAAPDADRLVEVHCFYSERCLVTVHRDDCPAFAEIRARYEKRKAPIEHPSLLLYKLIDGLVDSFFPILAEFDDRIDELEDAIFARADDEQLQEIFKMKRLLVGIRKAVSPQRDTFARLAGGIGELPGFTPEDERYFRDVYDHLISDQRPDRQLPRSAHRGHGRLPLHRLEPPERRHEAADRDRDDLPAAQLADRLLRPELRLDGGPHRPLGDLRRLRDRDRGARDGRAALLLQASRLVLTDSIIRPRPRSRSSPRHRAALRRGRGPFERAGRARRRRR